MIKSIRHLTILELEDYITSIGEKKFRANQLYDWIYKRGITSYSQISNLPKNMLNLIARDFPLPNMTIENIQEDMSDGSKKILLSLDDGNHIEAVLIPHHNDGNDFTICISTQVGCPIGCKFCATGNTGFTRNLTFDEIVSQVLLIKDKYVDIANIVVMGQGEPFLNYDNLVLALEYFNKAYAINVGARKITVSTCGIIDGIKKFSEQSAQYRLAVSLHSCIQSIRDKIMPISKTNNLIELKSALLEYNAKTNRRITIEYLLLKDINDSIKDANALCEFAQDLHCNVNILEYNEVDGLPFKRTDPRTRDEFIKILKINEINTICRISKGQNVSAACGQLANRVK